LGQESIVTLKKYRDLIIQTTSKGMGSTEPSNPENDPLWFYDFAGTEMIYDIVYEPEITPIMERAQKAGCRVSNGYTMLQYQAEEQYKLFNMAK
jgi:3-dehydroquinate dehydratase/shikimate dehydrogenase